MRIIYGAGVVGEELFHYSMRKGLAPPDGFFDDNPRKNELCGLPVYHELDLSASYCIAIADIADAVKRLKIKSYYQASLSSLWNFKSTDTYRQYAVDMTNICQLAYSIGIDFIHSVDLIITERCSLHCRDCSNLMQYYEHPQDLDTDGILKAVDALFDKVDEIGEVRLIGGEPFMHKHWSKIAKHLIAQPKLHKIVIYTNGTLVPNLSGLSDKVLVWVTDYGILSRRKEALIDELKLHKVPYVVRKASGWTKCDIIEAGRDGSFADCCVRNLTNLSDGKLYRCPFEANAVRLGKIPDDGLDVFAASREDIKAFLAKEELGACHWCIGRPYGAKEIPPAIQGKYVQTR